MMTRREIERHLDELRAVLIRRARHLDSVTLDEHAALLGYDANRRAIHAPVSVVMTFHATPRWPVPIVMDA